MLSKETTDKLIVASVSPSKSEPGEWHVQADTAAVPSIVPGVCEVMRVSATISASGSGGQR